ncbi:VOC family protein [Pseudomonas mediterranea]|uniref:VOC family protein n=1 Tax=Pseudomonas mediterranea TaxID=183795 RepID=UPI0006D8BB9B|nr:VOC family protein [Pseudomonas mediterranea]MDU9027495.1 VOC family protein [Pseudomonas mediterranea]
MFSSIGAVEQIAYVVDDLDKAIAHWNSLGVGPFFVIRRIQYVEQSYRGEPTNCEVSAAFSYFGDLQIELLEQLNNEPSSFKEYKEKKGCGMQHIGVISKDILGDTLQLERQGYIQVQRMVSTTGVVTVLFDSDRVGGSVIELIEETPSLLEGFAQLKLAAKNWDVSMPGVIEVPAH